MYCNKEFPLIRYQQRPCDFRILIQKDHQGIWQVTGIGVRVAGKNAISTHVPMGGSNRQCSSGSKNRLSRKSRLYL